MAKFKVGDRVIAKKDAPYSITTNGWKGVVTMIGKNSINVNAKDFFGSYGVTVDPKYFDLDTGCNQKIVITSDGKTTLARLYENNSVVKTAEAKCSPEDIFDFKTGANLACSRLMGLELVTVEEKPSFKKGDRVKITANSNVHNFEIGSIVTIVGDNADSANQWKCKGMDHYGKIDWWYVKESDMVKVDDSVDWNKFEAGKLYVKVNEDNFVDFVTEARLHGYDWDDSEDFDPFNDEGVRFIRALIGFNNELSNNEVYILMENKQLKISCHSDGNEIFTW